MYVVASPRGISLQAEAKQIHSWCRDFAQGPLQALQALLVPRR